jgi:maleylpyruvate isomerase
MDLKLHAYWRSGASYRARIALNLKGLAYEIVPVDLRAGAQSKDDYKAVNPIGMVPALEAGDDVYTQSPAILEWLEETYPDPPLLPGDPDGRAHVRAMCAVVGCDMQPLSNLRVLNALRELGGEQDLLDAWARRWMTQGFEALETLIGEHGDGWCFGNKPSLADCYLIPQVYSAERFGVDLSPYPHVREVAAEAADHPAFDAAHPDQQPDAPRDA